MHAANLLNKKRRLEAEKEKQQLQHGGGSPATASTPTTSGPTKHQNSKQHLLVDSQSQSTSSMVTGGGGASPLPPRHTHPSPLIEGSSGGESSRQCQSTSASCVHHNKSQKQKHKKEKKLKGPKCTDSASNTSTGGAPIPVYYPKEEHFNCAHVGLCIMILGVIIMTITGFVSHMLGFGEPGVIIVTGGACFCAVGLFLLCFGSTCYIRRKTKKAGFIPFIEIGRGSFDGNDIP